MFSEVHMELKLVLEEGNRASSRYRWEKLAHQDADELKLKGVVGTIFNRSCVELCRVRFSRFQGGGD